MLLLHMTPSVYKIVLLLLKVQTTSEPQAIDTVKHVSDCTLLS